jgi:hypothetical protein
MTLAASGELSIGGSTSNRSINLELQRAASATTNLDEFECRRLCNKPSSLGVISISDFYSKTYGVVAMDASYTADSGLQNFVNSAAIMFKSNGDIDVGITDPFGSFSYSNVGTWISPAAAAHNGYEIRVPTTPSYNGTFSGAINTWESLGSNRTWSITLNSSGSGFADFSIEIRFATTVLDSTAVYLIADVG